MGIKTTNMEDLRFRIINTPLGLNCLTLVNFHLDPPLLVIVTLFGIFIYFNVLQPIDTESVF